MTQADRIAALAAEYREAARTAPNRAERMRWIIAAERNERALTERNDAMRRERNAAYVASIASEPDYSAFRD